MANFGQRTASDEDLIDERVATMWTAEDLSCLMSQALPIARIYLRGVGRETASRVGKAAMR